MPSRQLLNLSKAEEKLYSKLTSSFKKGVMSQSYLMIGPRHASILTFVNSLIASIICSEDESPCGACKNCRMMHERTHPDLQYICKEEKNSSISIDRIRKLQFDIYQTPQCATYRFVVINPADKLNLSAANSLLKILEEPPKHTIFMLIAEQISSLPLTIISRCQKYFIKAPESFDGLGFEKYLSIAELYEETDERAILFENRFEIISLLHDLVTNKLNACDIAVIWKDYKLENIVWFLYLLTSGAIKYLLVDDIKVQSEYEKLAIFSQTQKLDSLFKQLDKLTGYFKKNQKNIVLNQTLVLENILLGYIPC
jgi:DNA polymerase III subunit delta'